MKRSDITDEEVMDMLPLHWVSMPVIDLLVDKGYPRKVAEAKIYHMLDRGLLECGTSINLVWRR